MREEMQIELKPCPFCGGDARVYYKMDIGIPSGDDGHKVSVKCENTLRCGAKIEKIISGFTYTDDAPVEGDGTGEQDD